MGKKTGTGRPADRRQIPRSRDTFFRLVVAVNSLAWLLLVAALILFHFARPDFVSGVQQYWGMGVEREWSQGYVEAMLTLLQICLGMSLVTMLLRSRRNRRQDDSFGVNLFILAGISLISLLTVTIQVN
ncbi:hypothetical protein OCL06_11635 [Alteromonas sp. ASW11-19]|uniref:Uncharacterized protein n=1 Tax=Alteromonas salexigens TaxID=2982530 RepID=A0ABT2VPJ9_9ALTE|nr:hypothetical protein [Alteromonas salexigens]MCU7555245.1 hypothetical protein [Alteromonas salexigens]